MGSENLNFGTLIHSFQFSDDSENSASRNLQVYASLFSKVNNISEVVEYALTVNDYNKPSEDQDQLHSHKTPKSILDFNVLYLVIRPTMVVSTEHVLHSIARSLTNVLNGKPVSSNFSTEVAFSLSGSSNVSKCVKNVLISKNDKPCSVLIVTLYQNTSEGNIFDLVQGDSDDLSNLSKYSNTDEILKDFKISEEELGLPGGLEKCILGRIGIKRI